MGDPDRMRRSYWGCADSRSLERSDSFEPIRKSVRLTTNQSHVSTNSLPPSQWLVSSFLIGTLFLSGHGCAVVPLFFGIDGFQIALFFAMLGACGILYYARYHRLFSHLTFQAHWIVRFFTVIFGAGALSIPYSSGPAKLAATISMWITMTTLYCITKVLF